ncbi:Putative uncharacterized protein [Lacticaseibacillus paracasei]|nr:Putative uncharacterized protein [Lacticaseibacillus paracasei]
MANIPFKQDTELQ